MFQLIGRDIVSAGGIMGSPTPDVLRLEFNKLDKAKGYAERYYKVGIYPFNWTQRENGDWYSGDLGSMDFTISTIITKD